MCIRDSLYTEDDFIVTQKANGMKDYALRPELPQPTLGGIIGPGDIKYVDVNGDGRIDSYDKIRGVGNPSVPEIIYGFGFNAEYKGIYASIFFQGAGNTSVLLGGATPEGWFPFAWGVDQSNYRTFALDRWTEDNPRQNVLMPRLHSLSLIHISEPTRRTPISYAVFCLKKKNQYLSLIHISEPTRQAEISYAVFCLHTSENKLPYQYAVDI